jgi:hypothetical protein
LLLGHYGLALAAKRATPGTSLGTLTLAANLADCAWPLLLLLGLEQVRVVPGLMATSPFDFKSYPYSHSLAVEALAGLVLGLLVYAARREVRSAVVVGLLVPSHWFLDVPFHRPDLPVWPGGPRFGFSLWNSVSVTLLAEALVFFGGLLLYTRTTMAKDRLGTVSLWAMVAFMLASYVGGVFGPPPASPTAVAYMSLGLWLFVPWTYWIDAHRRVRPD